MKSYNNIQVLLETTLEQHGTDTTQLVYTSAVKAIEERDYLATGLLLEDISYYCSNDERYYVIAVDHINKLACLTDFYETDDFYITNDYVSEYNYVTHNGIMMPVFDKTNINKR